MKRCLIAVVVSLAVLCCIYPVPSHSALFLENSYREIDASMTLTHWVTPLFGSPHWQTDTDDPPLKSTSYQGYWNENISASVSTQSLSNPLGQPHIASVTQYSNISLDTSLDTLTGAASGVVQRDEGGIAYSDFRFSFSIDSGNYSYALGVTRPLDGPVSDGFILGSLNNLGPNSSGIIGAGFYYIDFRFYDINDTQVVNPLFSYNYTNYNLSFLVEPYTESPTGAVPEPSTLLLLGSGLVGLVGYGRRKFKK